jgi:hypothetical protein
LLKLRQQVKMLVAIALSALSDSAAASAAAGSQQFRPCREAKCSIPLNSNWRLCKNCDETLCALGHPQLEADQCDMRQAPVVLEAGHFINVHQP